MTTMTKTKILNFNFELALLLKEALEKNALKVYHNLLTNHYSPTYPHHRYDSELNGFEFRLSSEAIYYQKPEALRLILRLCEYTDISQITRDPLPSDVPAWVLDVKSGIINPHIRQHLSLIHHFARSLSHLEDTNLQTLEILYQFGANLRERDAQGRLPLQVMEAWRTSENTCKVVCARLRELMGQPLGLKSQCRLVITRAMGFNFVTRLEKLPHLPPSVLAFLRFEGITGVTEQDYVPSDESPDSEDDL